MKRSKPSEVSTYWVAAKTSLLIKTTINHSNSNLHSMTVPLLIAIKEAKLEETLVASFQLGALGGRLQAISITLLVSLL
jgi:hypothetical protein